MSLQVWLPLNGNLHSQGLHNIEIENNGTTINNNGKIGKCYEFGQNKYIKLLNYASTFLTYNTWSLSVWFKCTAQNTAHTGSALISGGNWNQPTKLLQLSLGYFSTDHYTKLLISGSGSWANGYSYDFYLNTWYHVVLTSGNNAMRAYVNGELIGDSYSAYNPIELEQTWICIGNGTYNQSFHFYGLMNDIRIYDHCLSPKEIEEINRGLILHYKLDNDGWLFPNLITKSSYETEVWTNSGTDLSYVYDEDKGYKVMKLLPGGLHQKTSKADGPLLDLFGLSNYKANTQYTISFDMKEIREDNKKTNLYIGFYYTDDTVSWVVTNTINFNEWTHFSLTSTINKTVSRIKSTYGNGGYFLLDNIRLVESPIEKDGYIPVDEVSNIIYDCSGYGNNGTIIGTLSAVAGSPRYQIATSMNNTSTSNHIEANAINIPDNIFTVSLWVKSAKSKNQVLFADPQMVIGQLNSLIYVCRTSIKGFATSHFQDGQWNHIVATRNGDTYQVYINGELEAQNGGSNNYLHNESTLWLFNRSYNNNYAANTTMSDIRVYTTILSAAAVQELYKTSMLVDASGNITPRSVEEASI